MFLLMRPHHESGWARVDESNCSLSHICCNTNIHVAFILSRLNLQVGPIVLNGVRRLQILTAWKLPTLPSGTKTRKETTKIILAAKS